MKLKSLLLLLGLLVINFIDAQKSNTGTWLMVFGNEKLNSRFNIHYEVQHRDFAVVGDLNQLLLRTGVGYNLTENNNNLLLGYAYIHTNSYDLDQNKIQSDEHRLYQQFITKQKFGRVGINHRYRVEERFFATKTQLRFRYHLNLVVPFSNTELLKNTWYASAYNEIFINAENEIFDRNRIYGAIGFVVNEKLKVEAGFMNQALKQNSRNQFQLGFYLSDIL